MYDVVNMPDLVIRYFSSVPWLLTFIASTVYLFFRLNTAKKRAMLAAVVVFFAIINAYSIQLFTRLDQNSTFYRHLWAIPSIVIIGMAIIDLIRIIPKWYLRIPMIAVLVIGLWFINGQEYIRCRVQVFSIEGTLVPEDVIELGDKLEELRKESGKNTLFVVCPSGYERPYGNMVTELGLYSGCLKVCDSSVISDENHDGETELMGENPDIDYIISACCTKGIDYVIISRGDKAEVSNRQKGYEEVVCTDNFLLYECKGHSGYKRDMSPSGTLMWMEWYNENGNIVKNEYGYSKVEFIYDGSGNIINERYFDHGQLVVRIDVGFAELERSFDRLGRRVREAYYDTNHNPVIRIGSGYAEVVWVYDKSGEAKKRYYDQFGNEI